MWSLDISTLNDGFLLITFSGEVDDKSDINLIKSKIADISKEVKNFHQKQGKNIKVLIDITNLTATYIEEAVNALVEVAKEDEELVEKSAVFGGSMKIRIIGDTIVALSGRHNIKFFKDRAGATLWLNS